MSFPKKVRALLLFFTGWFILSCEYHTNEVYFKEIEQPDWSGVTIDLNVVNDTIYIFQTTRLDFTAMLGKHQVRGVYAYLGDRLVLTSGAQLYPITIDPQYFASGTYKLMLEVNLTSETGSLADLRGYEVTKINREWTVIIDHDTPSKIHFTSIDTLDGGLELKWEKYEKWNFQYYKLSKYCYNAFNNFFEHCWTKQIDSKETVFLSDSSFIGGTAKYIVSVSAANKFSDPDERQIEIQYDPELEYQWVDNQRLKLMWHKPSLYQNVQSYQINFPNDGDTRSFSSKNVNETTIEVEAQIKFPAQKQIRILITPKGANDYNKGNLYGFNTAIIGSFSPGFLGESLTYNTVLNKYFAIGYANNQKSLIMMDPITFEIENSFPSQEEMFALSENGVHLHVINDGKLVTLNPTDFSVITSHDFQVWLSAYNFMKVSNNNRLIVDSRVWDLNTMTLEQTLPSGLFSITPDGEYIFGFSKLYRYTGSLFEEVTQFGTLSTWGELTPDNKFLNYTQNSINIYNLSSMSLESSIPSSGARYLHMDPATGLIGGFTDSFAQGPKKFYVFSTTGLEMEFDIGNISTQYSYLLLVNDNLACSCSNVVPLAWYK